MLVLEKIEDIIRNLDDGISRENLIQTTAAYERLREWYEHLKELLSKEFVEDNFEEFSRHMHFIDYYLKERDFEWIRSNFNDIKKDDFPKVKLKILDELESIQTATQIINKKYGNKIFIVHGRDTKPIKDLKKILKELGLNPIVLHEKASGGRTLIEKLEKHSDVGFAFILLTPDDAGYCQYERRVLSNDYGVRIKLTLRKLRSLIKKEHDVIIATIMKGFVDVLRVRARQNVVLEFGFFIGKLGRNRVCCLYKGDVELPSDMKGIVYVPFEKNLNECKDKIIEELKEAGYKIQT